MASPAIELNIPDLPEVPIQLGPSVRSTQPRAPVPWSIRLRDAFTAYLPLLLMVLLALGTWWLVKNSPQPMQPRTQASVRTEPDYTMKGFAVQRFARDGRLLVRVEGSQLRHFPDTDRTEIDSVTLRAYSPDGRETVATASRALANGDATDVQLLGGAQVRSRTPVGEPVEIDSDFLHILTLTEQVKTHLPVHLRVGSSDLRASGLVFDNLTGRAELMGPMRAVVESGAMGGKR
jgi:lipopolysaccharide export system protein LptC